MPVKISAWLSSPLFLFSLAGFIFALSFPSSFLEDVPQLARLDQYLQNGLPFLIFLFALPLLFGLEKLCSLKETLFYGAFYGLGSYLLLSLWLLEYDWVAFILVPGIYFVYFTLFFGTYYLLCKQIKNSWVRYAVFVLLWMLLEYAKSTGWVAYTYGSLLYSQYLSPQAMRFSSNFVLQNLSYILIFTPAISVHACIQHYKTSKSRWLLLIGPLLATFVAISVLYNFPSSIFPKPQQTANPDENTPLKQSDVLNTPLPISADKLNVALLQHNINSWQTEEDTSPQALERLLKLSRQAEQHNAELIIWSETAFVPVYRFQRERNAKPIQQNIRKLKQRLEQTKDGPERNQLASNLQYLKDSFQKIQMAQRLDAYLEEAKATYLIGTNDYGHLPGEPRDGLYNAMLLIQKGQIIATYHKQRLVPFTEEAKWERYLPRLNALLRRHDLAQYNSGSGSPILKLPLQQKIRPALRLYAMICYEDSLPLYWPHKNLTAPDLSKALETQDFDVLVSVSNDSWSASAIGGLQHLSSSLSRAVEMQRYFLRGSTSGQTAAIGPKGRLQARLPANTPGILYFRLPL